MHEPAKTRPLRHASSSRRERSGTLGFGPAIPYGSRTRPPGGKTRGTSTPELESPDPSQGRQVHSCRARWVSRFIDEGKVRAIGVSNFGVDLHELCERVHLVDPLHTPFSLIVRVSAGDVIPWAAAHGTGVIVYSSMGSGILTEPFSRERAASPTAPRLTQSVL